MTITYFDRRANFIQRVPFMLKMFSNIHNIPQNATMAFIHATPSYPSLWLRAWSLMSNATGKRVSILYDSQQFQHRIKLLLTKTHPSHLLLVPFSSNLLRYIVRFFVLYFLSLNYELAMVFPIVRRACYKLTNTTCVYLKS